MKISIIAVGKLKEKYLKEAVKEYSKKLNNFYKFTIIEVNDEKAPENSSEKENALVMKKEGERILNRIKVNQYVIALDIKGKQMSSEKFANLFNEKKNYNKNDIVFIIGGSLGLSQEVLKRANERLSFSMMTFPHQLMRIIILEQIYRIN